MTKRWVVGFALLLLVALLGVPTASAQGRNQNPQILPPHSSAYGMEYADWSVKWWQWVFSLPSTNNPILDTGDCSAGQSGKVWFLAGAFEPKTITRSCTVPPGTALFFPAYNAWADNTWCPDWTTFTPDELKGFAGWWIDNAPTGVVHVTIDGVPVAALDPAAASPYRVGAQLFSYQLSATNNIIGDYFGPLFGVDLGCIADGTFVAEAAEDGLYLLLAPLSAGHHTLRIEVQDFFDITYELTVRK